MHIFINFYPFPWSYAHPSTASLDLQEIWTAGEENSVDHQPLESCTVRNVMFMELDASSSPEMHLGTFYHVCQHSFTPFFFFAGLQLHVTNVFTMYGTIYVC